MLKQFVSSLRYSQAKKVMRAMEKNRLEDKVIDIHVSHSQ